MIVVTYPLMVTNKTLMPNMLLHISVQETHNSLVSPPEEDDIKYSRYSYNNIIISEPTLCQLLPPQLKNMT